jgi:two-component system response regulator CpxR
MTDDVAVARLWKLLSRMNDNHISASVVLIDDDRELGAMLTDFLRPDRLELTRCGSGEDGLECLASGSFDLVILDIMLPGISGLDVLKQIRQTSDIPIIMLTARGDDVDRIIGLEFGADDYLAKPFNPRELSARIKAILRRLQRDAANSSLLKLGEIELDSRMRRASVHWAAGCYPTIAASTPTSAICGVSSSARDTGRNPYRISVAWVTC